MYATLAIIATFIFFYSIASKGLERTPVNGAILFSGFGLAMGPLGFDLLQVTMDAEGLRTLAELTLALVLFTDAANADLGVLKHSIRLPQRLLLTGLPLTILMGFGIGVVLFDTLTLLEIAILSIMLAPTDAALGKAVVSDESVPGKIREGLNVESGLNDGICVPILLVFLLLAGNSGDQGNTVMLVLKFMVNEIGIGVAVGVGLTMVAGWMIKKFADLEWITETWRQLPVVTLSITCFALAQWAGGSGFIASFVAGLLFGRLVKAHKKDLLLAAEGTGDTLALITWVIFGVAVVGQSFASFSWEVVLYALLSLTIVRMLPVFLVLSGMNIGREEKLFMGWFGPRGLASIVFAVIVLNENLPGSGLIVTTAVCTISMSIVAHGLSATPLVAALKSRLGLHQSKT